MRVLLTGANGWVGSVVAGELIDAGHAVVGLVRSKEKGEALADAGGTPLIGSLGDLDVLRRGAEEAEGVIHTAFGLDFSRMAELGEEDRRAIETFGEVFAGGEGGRIVEIRAGDVIWCPPGERHWEGATPDQAMAYVAVQEEPDGRGVEFGEKVTDEEYGKGAVDRLNGKDR